MSSGFDIHIQSTDLAFNQVKASILLVPYDVLNDNLFTSNIIVKKALVQNI